MTSNEQHVESNVDFLFFNYSVQNRVKRVKLEVLCDLSNMLRFYFVGRIRLQFLIGVLCFTMYYYLTSSYSVRQMEKFAEYSSPTEYSPNSRNL